MLTVCFGVCLQAMSARADSVVTARDHLAISVSGSASYLIPKGDINKQILHSYGTGFYDASLLWHTCRADSNAFDAAFRYPDLQAGLLVGDFSHVHVWRARTGYESRIGQLIALYGGFHRNFVQRRRWAFDLYFQNGVALCTAPYNDDTNRDNELIGSRFSLFVALGARARYRIAPRWSLSLGIDFRHFSNGQLARPNLGANTIGPTLGVSYELAEEPSTCLASNTSTEDEGNQVGEGSGARKMHDWYMELSASVIPKTLLEHFNLYHTSHSPMYMGYSTMAAAMYRYRLHHASGIEADYTYASYADKIKELDIALNHDNYRYSRHVLGVGVRHEIFYKHVSLNLGAGVYLFRRMGYYGEHYDSRLYQFLGLRYSFPFTSDRLFIGYSVKAHRFSKADSMLFTLGWRIGTQSPLTSYNVNT